MSRPFGHRRIEFEPRVTCFKPRGVSGAEEVILTLDEVEALRLSHAEGLFHKEAGMKMDVSRQTFGNIINSAYQKMTDGIINGKIIRIEADAARSQGKRTIRCLACHHRWNIGYGTRRPKVCPECGSDKLLRAMPKKGAGKTGRTGKGKSAKKIMS